MPKRDPKELTSREWELVKYILTHPDKSHTAACVAVGWAPGSAGKVLIRPRVRAAIAHGWSLKLEKAITEEMIKKIAAMVEECLSGKFWLFRSLLDEKQNG